MDIPSLTTAMTSLSIAKEAVSAAIGLRDFNAVAATLAGVNDQLLKAQDGLFVYSTRLAELQDKLAQCQDELRELKRVQSEREKYALFQIQEGVWVYRSNPLPESSEGGSQAVEPPHYLCQGCFDQGKKFVLRLGGSHWHCNGCKAAYPAGGHREPLRVRPMWGNGD